MTKYKIKDRLWHKDLKQYVQIVEIMMTVGEESTYKAVYSKSDRGEPIADWCYCIDNQLCLEDPKTQVFYLERGEPIVRYFQWKLEANSFEEACEKLRNGEGEEVGYYDEADFYSEPFVDIMEIGHAEIQAKKED